MLCVPPGRITGPGGIGVFCESPSFTSERCSTADLFYKSPMTLHDGNVEMVAMLSEELSLLVKNMKESVSSRIWVP